MIKALGGNVFVAACPRCLVAGDTESKHPLVIGGGKICPDRRVSVAGFGDLYGVNVVFTEVLVWVYL